MTGRAPDGWRVSLAVRTTGVTTDDVSARLGVPADRATSRPDRRWPYVWERDSGLPPEAELDEHLVALAARCGAATAEIARLAAGDGASVTIEAVLRGAGRTAPGLWIPPAAAAFAAACGIGIDLDLYL